eukprot:3938621-Rhodomonas_salina.2
MLWDCRVCIRGRVPQARTDNFGLGSGSIRTSAVIQDEAVGTTGTKMKIGAPDSRPNAKVRRVLQSKGDAGRGRFADATVCGARCESCGCSGLCIHSKHAHLSHAGTWTINQCESCRRAVKLRLCWTRPFRPPPPAAP